MPGCGKVTIDATSTAMLSKQWNPHVACRHTITLRQICTCSPAACAPGDDQNGTLTLPRSRLYTMVRHAHWPDALAGHGADSATSLNWHWARRMPTPHTCFLADKTLPALSIRPTNNLTDSHCAPYNDCGTVCRALRGPLCILAAVLRTRRCVVQQQSRGADQVL